MSQVSERKLAANTLNAQKSTGPRSEAGKRKSSRNAVKHGLTGAEVVLPHEDRDAFDRRLGDWTDSFRPSNEAQRCLVTRGALASWKLDRCARHETAVLSEKVRHARDRWDLEQQARAFALGRRLLADPVHRTGALNVDRNDPKFIAWQAEEPALLVAELILSSHGCAWLLARWDELADVLTDEGYWHYDAKFNALRMLGKRPEDLLYDRTVGAIMLACHAAHPSPWEWPQEVLQTAVGTDNRPMYDRRVEALKSRLPASADEARSILARVVEAERARLLARLEQLTPLDALARDGAEDRAAFLDTKAGELLRRYESAAERQLHRALTDLMKLAKVQADGEESGPSGDETPGPEGGPADPDSPETPAVDADVTEPNVSRNEPTARPGLWPRASEIGPDRPGMVPSGA